MFYPPGTPPPDKVSAVLADLLDRFSSPDFPQAVAYACFPIAAEIPAATWSLGNRVLMLLAGTDDARGFQQWKDAGRFVKKGSHAFSILIPRLAKKENAAGEEEKFLAGFLTGPVFRVEDTDGEPLDYESIQLPEFPLLDIARSLGISVKSMPDNGRYYGFYKPSADMICLATAEEIVFFHELAHAVHYRVCPDVSKDCTQISRKEIVAELSAAALCVLVGKSGFVYLANSFHYVKSYVAESKKTPVAACFKVLEDVEKILRFLCASSLWPASVAPVAPVAPVPAPVEVAPELVLV